MANSSYSYTIKNNIAHYIKIKRAMRVAEEGRNFLIRDIEDELAAYCEVTRSAIRMIKQNSNQPGLAVAVKIAMYFNVPVEELFTLVDADDNTADTDGE